MSELFWIQGFTAKDIAALSPYVTVLPVGNVPINVNTCSPTIMQVLTNPPLSDAAVAALIDGRTERGYQSVKDFLARPELAGKGSAISKLITVSSSYFMLNNRAKYGRIAYDLRTLVQREKTNGRITIISRRRVVP